MTYCPSCSGSDVEVLRAGVYRCVSLRVMGVMQPGMGGNFGPSPQPVPGVCGNVYTAAEGEWAAAATSRQALERTRSKRRYEQEREDSARELRLRAPANFERIGEVAGELIRERPAGSKAVVRLAEIWSKGRFFGSKMEHGWAEVDRAWPVGEVPVEKGGGWGTTHIQYRPAGATAEGRILLLRGGPENLYAGPEHGIPMTPETVVLEPKEGDEKERGIFVRHEHLDQIRRDLEQVLESDEYVGVHPEQPEPPPCFFAGPHAFMRNRDAGHYGPAYWPSRRDQRYE